MSRWLVAAFSVAVLAMVDASPGASAPMAPQTAAPEMADASLVLAVDVSNSVTPNRYGMQMEGIAAALSDPDVRRAMLSGPHKAIFLTLVERANGIHVTVPWMLITGEAQIDRFALDVQLAPRTGDGLTCVATMLQFVREDVLPRLPAPATRIVIDVSGDGRDDCGGAIPRSDADPASQPVLLMRDDLAEEGITINGMPILEGNEALTLEDWYRGHVIGGKDAFLVPARGFDDIARAMRHKFVAELLSQR